MADELTRRLHERIEHAQWRLEFVSKMLETHYTLPFRPQSWHTKEREYQERLAHAQEQLEAAMKEVQ